MATAQCITAPPVVRARSGLLLVVLVTLNACVAPFSELQSARMTGVGRQEITPTFSIINTERPDGSHLIQTQVGVQAAAGVHRHIDLRLRYERVTAIDDITDNSTNVLSVGAKLPVLRDRLALYLPIGAAFGGGIETSETFQFHPTVLFTIPATSHLEINTSLKGLIPFGSNDGDPLVAVNLGLGISTPDRTWTFRPEVGLLRKPNDSGHFRHLSFGVTRGFGR